MKALLLALSLSVPAFQEIPLQIAPSLAAPSDSLRQAEIVRLNALLDTLDKATDGVRETKQPVIYMLRTDNING